MNSSTYKSDDKESIDWIPYSPSPETQRRPNWESYEKIDFFHQYYTNFGIVKDHTNTVTHDAKNAVTPSESSRKRKCNTPLGRMAFDKLTKMNDEKPEAARKLSFSESEKCEEENEEENEKENDGKTVMVEKKLEPNKNRRESLRDSGFGLEEVQV